MWTASQPPGFRPIHIKAAVAANLSPNGVPAEGVGEAAGLRGLVFGYGFSMAMMIKASLGLDPWDVLHQGLTRYLPFSFGTVTIIVGAIVLLLWIKFGDRARARS